MHVAFVCQQLRHQMQRISYDVLRGSVAELLRQCFVLNCVRAIFHRLGFCIRSVRHSVQTRICWQTIDLTFVPMCPRPKCIISTPRNVTGAEQHQNLAYSAHSKQQIPAYCFQSDCSRLLACQCVVRSVCDVMTVRNVPIYATVVVCLTGAFF